MTNSLEISSLRLQLEYWSDGIMGDLVLSNVIEEKGRNGLLAILLLTGKLISESFFEVNIPIFHYTKSKEENEASRNFLNFNKL